MALATKSRQPFIDAFEDGIDSCINASSGGRVVIAVKKLGEITSREWSLLSKKYISVGWKKAEWVSDQRDGDFIDLDI